MHKYRHRQLSDLTDDNENIYGMTRDIAAVAKQIKEDSKEDTGHSNPVLEAVDRIYDNDFGSLDSAQDAQAN